ncbi:MAG: hypothetical protein GTO29_13495 [Candidatus Latescibacteria bacterium]|nr:hypothetical protein [Candidatus Latescibacterota bacterium]NIO57266.1 hypothetical protein [Candidatus Latescibacterota bacterium]
MDTEQIKKMNLWLQSRISMDNTADGIVIKFDEPTAADFIAQGFDEETVNLTIKSSWWSEMVTDIIETPDFVDPEESPEQILKYARDLVFEYVGKRLYPY